MHTPLFCCCCLGGLAIFIICPTTFGAPLNEKKCAEDIPVLVTSLMLGLEETVMVLCVVVEELVLAVDVVLVVDRSLINKLGGNREWADATPITFKIQYNII